MAPSAKSASKRYSCTEEGCGKAFTRSDHLRRHLLNHADGGSTCPRCSLHFKRADLLDRHMLHHQQKDDEAGGEGLGVIETRKRLWRDADGNIVSKRPLQPNVATASREGGREACAENHQPPPNANGTQPAVRREPLSPPSSMSSVEQRDQASHNLPQMPLDQSLLHSTADMGDFLANSSWDFHPSIRAEAPFDDVFNPDTASSFNMPFTTMTNYNWLFGLDNTMSMAMGAYLPGDLLVDTHNSTTTSEMQAAPYPSSNNAGSGDSRPDEGNVSTTGPAVDSYRYQPTIQQDGNSFLSFSGHHGETSELNQPAAFERSVSPSTPRARRYLSSVPQQLEGPHTRASLSGDLIPSSTGDQSGIRLAESQNYHQHCLDCESSLSSQRRKNRPMIDETIRKDILDLLADSQLITPDGATIDGTHPLLSLHSMQDHLDLFFSHFNTVYPMLHQATFEPSQTEPLLVLAILLLGATYGEKDVHMLAVCIHDVLRALIFQHSSFSATPELWMLQTILLVECFGKSRAGQKQHDMAHLFHGLLINLIRRSDCQTVRQPTLEKGSDDIDTMWRKAIDVEMRKRVAFLCFLWDTQHAVLFSQSLCMSSFELRTNLPCNEATWEASSAEEWWHHAMEEPQISYLSVLKAYMNSDLGIEIPQLNFFSRLLALHGLMSIQWDMKRRDQTSLGITDHILAGSSQSARWQYRLARSYDAWKADFDNFCMNMLLSLSDSTSRRAEFTRLSTATNAIYHAAHITLNVEILDLQIYAGARHIIGRPVTRADYERSRRTIKDWAKPHGQSSSSFNAVHHSACLLKDGIMNLEIWDVSNAFHYPWCLYLATLTCWAFHYANMIDTSDGRDSTFYHDHNSRQQYMIASRDSSSAGAAAPEIGVSTGCGNAKSEMISLVGNMARAKPEDLWRVVSKSSSRGLITIISNHLSNVRWAVVHEGMKVLRELLAERGGGLLPERNRRIM